METKKFDGLKAYLYQSAMPLARLFDSVAASDNLQNIYTWQRWKITPNRNVMVYSEDKFNSTLQLVNYENDVQNAFENYITLRRLMHAPIAEFSKFLFGSTTGDKSICI